MTYNFINLRDTYKIASWQYPGGERGVRINPALQFKNDGCDVLVARLQKSDDVMDLLLTVDALKRGVGFCPRTAGLIIPYLPYARQDRVADGGDPHALKVFANLIDSLGFGSVMCVDAHSSVGQGCFNNSVLNNYVPEKEISQFFDKVGASGRNKVVLVSPDQGATKKVEYYASKWHMPMIHAYKKRDPATGKLGGFGLMPGSEIEKFDANAHYIIVDDICDGGGTFIGLADVMRPLMPATAKLSLFTTHGIYSKGLDALNAKFNHIGCTNSYNSVRDSNLIEVKLPF